MVELTIKWLFFIKSVSCSRILRNLSNPADPFYFVKVTEKGTAIKDMTYPYSNSIHTDELFFRRNYLKLTRLRSLNDKKFQILPISVLFSLDDMHNTYVEIDNDLQLNINIYNALVAKAHI